MILLDVFQKKVSTIHKLVYPKQEITLPISWFWNFFKLPQIYNIYLIPKGYPSEFLSRLRSMKKLEDLIVTYKDFPKKVLILKRSRNSLIPRYF